jgi:putative transposase
MDDDRLMLTDEIWDRIVAIVATVKSAAGAPPELSDRDFVEAILYVARTGIPWRDLPRRFGDWNAVYQRFRRWEKMGVWSALFEQMPEDLAAVKELLFDSTIIRAHAHAAGAPAEKGGKRHKRSVAAAAVSAPSCTWLRPTSRPRWR